MIKANSFVNIISLIGLCLVILLHTDELKFFFPKSWQPHGDAHRSFEEICQNAGYESSSYLVQTEDGYINHMFRIHANTTNMT
jgi:hypothetical protein